MDDLEITPPESQRIPRWKIVLQRLAMGFLCVVLLLSIVYVITAIVCEFTGDCAKRLDGLSSTGLIIQIASYVMYKLIDSQNKNQEKKLSRRQKLLLAYEQERRMYKKAGIPLLEELAQLREYVKITSDTISSSASNSPYFDNV